jgi:hypothetical protein
MRVSNCGLLEGCLALIRDFWKFGRRVKIEIFFMCRRTHRKAGAFL